MASSHAKSQSKSTVLHLARFLMAIFALLLAATHLPFAGDSGGGSAPTHAPTSGTSNSVGTGTGAPSGGFSGFAAQSLWFEIEVVAYTIIAVVFLLGLRSWYLPSIAFNVFNLALYLLSGAIAIPGITTAPYGSHLAILSGSLSTEVLLFSWFAFTVFGLIMLKKDPGSKLDDHLVTKD